MTATWYIRTNARHDRSESGGRRFRRAVQRDQGLAHSARADELLGRLRQAVVQELEEQAFIDPVLLERVNALHLTRYLAQPEGDDLVGLIELLLTQPGGDEIGARLAELSRNLPPFTVHGLNRGLAWVFRWLLVREETDLDQAVDDLRMAAAWRPADGSTTPERAVVLSNLGGTLRIRYELRHDRADLDDAIAAQALHRAVRNVRSAESPERWALYLHTGL